MPTFPAIAELVCYTGLAVAGLCEIVQRLGCCRGWVAGPEELPFGIELEE